MGLFTSTSTGRGCISIGHYLNMTQRGLPTAPARSSLGQLYVDLDADNIARDGVVIDVRNNNGGFVNAYALDVFSRQQRALEKPTVLVTNQHSLSDAEDFTEGQRSGR